MRFKNQTPSAQNKSQNTSRTTRRLRGGLLGLSVLAVIGWSLWSLAPFHQPRPTPAQDAALFKQHLDARVPALLERFGVPGVSIATVVDGKPAASFAYGFADVAQARPMTADSVFEVASISKSFTAWGVMRMVDAGQLELDAPVERYIAPWPLPDAPFPRNQVTIRRLLSHTAGVNPGNLGVRLPDEPALSTRRVLRGEGVNSAIETAGPTRLEFPAGERFFYSNPGYMLLQLALEQQSGLPFGDYMKAQVLTPLGMTASSFDWDPALRARTATPYLADGSASPITILQDQATGSLFSTAPDLAKFLAAELAPPSNTGLSSTLSTDLSSGLSPKSMTALHAPVIDLPATDVQGLASDSGALGHYVEQLPNGSRAIMNGGFVPGWTSQFYVVPNTGDGIVVLTNSDRGRAVIAEIVADWAAWRGLPMLKMTQTYNVVGTIGPFVIGLLVLLALVMTLNVITDLMHQRRRLGPASFGQVARAVGLLIPAVALGFLWFGMARMIVMFGFPWLEAPMTLAISVLGIALVGSAILPHKKRAQTELSRATSTAHVSAAAS